MGISSGGKCSYVFLAGHGFFSDLSFTSIIVYIAVMYKRPKKDVLLLALAQVVHYTPSEVWKGGAKMRLYLPDLSEKDRIQLTRFCLYCGKRIAFTQCSCGAWFTSHTSPFFRWSRYVGVGRVTLRQCRWGYDADGRRAQGEYVFTFGRSWWEWFTAPFRFLDRESGTFPRYSGR